MAERRAPQKSGEKLAFLLALVPYLIDQARVTVAEAAAHFGVTPAQMREYVTYLTATGDPGAEGLYQHDGLFDIDWDDFDERDVIRFRAAPLQQRPRFSAREAAALLAGLQSVAALPEFAERPEIAQLMAKLARGSASTVTPLAVHPTAVDPLRTIVAAAVAGRERLRIDYVTSKGERELREVDPLRLESIDDVWYLRGWSLSRDAERTFRLDRMASAEPIGPAAAHPASTAPGELFRGDADDLRVTVGMPASALGLLHDFLGPEDEVVYSGDQAVVTIPLAHEGMIGRLAARLAGVGSITAPEHARRTAAEWARAALAAAGETPAPA